MGKKIQRLRFVLFLVGLLVLTSTASAGDMKKMDALGTELPDDATSWAIVFEPGSGLYWEVKTDDDSIHSNKKVYKFSKVNEELVDKLNEEKFGGFTDWRLPTTGELSALKEKGKVPAIDQSYFPNTMPSRYLSYGWCGSKSEFQPESVKLGKEKSKGGKYAMATRGKPLEP